MKGMSQGMAREGEAGLNHWRKNLLSLNQTLKRTLQMKLNNHLTRSRKILKMNLREEKRVKLLKETRTNL